MIEIYDVMTKQTIRLNNIDDCKKINKNYEIRTFWGLFKQNALHCFARYIHPKNKDKIFTLVELDTGKEYDCISARTIFLYFNLPFNKNESSYINRMRYGGQQLASICNSVFYLKNNKFCYKRQKTNLKNKSIVIDRRKKDNKIRKKIYTSLCKRINCALNRKNIQKLNHTEELIACKIDFFIGYMEAQFTKGMTWSNYGQYGWHIDHIKPCYTFNLNNIEQQKQCFNYTNLRPLWATKEIAIKHGETENYVGNLNRNKNEKFI